MEETPHDKTTFLVVIAAALICAALLYLLRQRGPVRGRGPTGAPSPVCERVDAAYRPWTMIVVHHSATGSGSAAAFDKLHKEKGWDELGYHFVIGNGKGSDPGRIEAGERWRLQKAGAHAKGVNAVAIGVCLVGDFEKTSPTPKQMRSLVALVRWLQRRFRIPPERIFLHRQVAAAPTACPGARFPEQTFRTALVRPSPSNKTKK